VRPRTCVNEDPVCGSGNGSVAVFRRERGSVAAAGAAYTAAQGRCVGRDGRIEVEFGAEGKIMIGGSCITSVDGTLRC